MSNIIEKILEADPNRSTSMLPRRMVKLQEEVGELAECIVDCFWEYHRKGKEWGDIREEAIDVAIIAIDMAFSIPHSDPNVELIEILGMFEKKLEKFKYWKNKGVC